ncbi:hypothetical protein ABZ619_39030 [Streptomyces sp. NPDC007851]|uniref:hypothetical protein n=1 Tax=Streptomyces sp. NPDC007851 TaxID=3155008 RepID=UPI0033EF926F
MTTTNHTTPAIPAPAGIPGSEHDHRYEDFGPHAGERCVTCNAPKPDMQAVVRAAAEVLAPEHTPAARNDWGACTEAGFSVNPGTNGRARVHHQLPNLNLYDPNRLSGHARWAVCRARVETYAATLRAAGWTVEERTVTTGAILLASPPGPIKDA